MTEAIKQCQKAFRYSFMQPKAYLGAEIELDLLASGHEGIEHDKYYCRLSADGFLDCTDWHGPFDTLDDCAIFLVETYAEESI